MIFTAAGRVNEAEIETGVRKVEKDFAQEVVRIRYSFGEDHLDAPAAFFRIVVRDEAAPTGHLVDIAQRISRALRNEARVDENDLHAYFRYRRVSEQQKLQDPAWN